MKVGNNQNSAVVKFPGRDNPLLELKAGDKINVSVISRIGRSEALLESGGRQFTAKFTGQIPGDKVFTLVLTENRNGSLRFALPGRENQSGGIDIIKDIFAGPRADFHLLKTLSPERITDIFSLNLILFGKHDLKRIDRHKALLRFLNSLKDAGFNNLELTSFSHILISVQNDRLLKYYRFISDEGRFFDADSIGETIKKVLEYADTLDNKDKTDILAELSSLSCSGDGLEFVPVFDGEEFRSFKLFSAENYAVVSADFSALGHVDIILKKTGDMVNMVFYLDNDTAVHYFIEKADDFKGTMADDGLSCTMYFYSRDSAIADLSTIINSGAHGVMINKRV